VKIKLRWLLPICNLVIDLVLLAMLAHYDVTHPGLRLRTSLDLTVRAQEAAPGIRFEPRYIDAPIPPPAAQLLAGCFPAAIIATFSMPGAADRREIRWFVLLELLSLPIWFWLGFLAERDRALALSMGIFVVIRLAMLWISSELASTPLASFWFLLTAYLVIKAARAGFAHFRRHAR
jgi:hypothetical protein